MTRSELIDRVTLRQSGRLMADDVKMAVKCIIEQMSGALASGDRIEIRGFGSFRLHYWPARTGRNPKTGKMVALAGIHVPRFEPGKPLRDRVDEARRREMSGGGQRRVKQR